MRLQRITIDVPVELVQKADRLARHYRQSRTFVVAALLAAGGKEDVEGALVRAGSETE